MDMIFTVLKYAFFSVFGLVGLLFVLALLFGKRVHKQWEYEAKFRDDKQREFGDFDIELSRISKEETEDRFKATFKMRHESLQSGLIVQVFLDDVLVMEGNVTTAGRVYLTAPHIKNALTEARNGQMCRIVYGGVERFSQEIIPD